VLAGACLGTFFPIELAELRSQFELRREGVRAVHSGELAQRAYTPT
jgi:hypothetical protein